MSFLAITALRFCISSTKNLVFHLYQGDAFLGVSCLCFTASVSMMQILAYFSTFCSFLYISFNHPVFSLYCIGWSHNFCQNSLGASASVANCSCFLFLLSSFLTHSYYFILSWQNWIVPEQNRLNLLFSAEMTFSSSLLKPKTSSLLFSQRSIFSCCLKI